MAVTLSIYPGASLLNCTYNRSRVNSVVFYIKRIVLGVFSGTNVMRDADGLPFVVAFFVVYVFILLFLQSCSSVGCSTTRHRRSIPWCTLLRRRCRRSTRSWTLLR